MSVSIGGHDLKDTILDRKERDTASASTQIEDKNFTLLSVVLFKAISYSGAGWLVDDSLHV